MDSESGKATKSHKNVRKNDKGIDLKVAEVLKIIKSDKEDIKGNVPEESERRSAEIIKLVEDIQKQYHKLYGRYQFSKKSHEKKEKDTTSSSDFSTSGTDYYSSDDKDTVHHINESIAPTNIKGKASFKDVLTMDTKELNERKQGSLEAMRYDLESKALECRRLESIQNQLKKRVSDLEFLVKNKGDEVSIAKRKLKENETRMTSEKKILQNEVETLRRQKEELESVRENQVLKLREEINDVSCQRLELEKRLQNRSDEICSLKKELDVLEDEMEKKGFCIEECRNENFSLNRMNDELRKELDLLRLENKAEKDMLEHDNKLLQSSNEYLKLQMRELRDVVEGDSKDIRRREEKLSSERENLLLQRNELEESLKKSMMNEEILKNKLLGMERSLSECADEMVKVHTMRDEESLEISARKTQVGCLQQEVTSLVGEKNMIEAKNEEIKERFKERQKEAKSEIHNLNEKVVHKLRASKDKEKGLNKTEDLKQIKSVSGEFPKQRLFDSPRSLGVDSPKYSQRSLERKIEELADKFQMNIENHVRLLYQRILVVEQIQSESKDHFKKSKEFFHEENSKINGKLSALELKIANLSSLFEPTKEKQKKRESNSDFSGRMERLSNDIQIAREWASGKNNEVESLKQQLKVLTAHKKKGEWKELLNDEEELNKFEIRADYLEHLLRDREEVLLSLVEEKREAIRQLCIIIDYHRQRYEDIKLTFSKMRTHEHTVSKFTGRRF